jgi:2-aminoadipate transaminase
MEKNIITFNRGVPPTESFQAEWLIECASEALREDGAAILQYGSPAGYTPLVEWLTDRFQVENEQVIIGQGSLQLLDMLVNSHTGSDVNIFVEQPTYDRPMTIFNRAGANIIGFPLINGRLQMDEIERMISDGTSPDYFYLIPDFQNPSGAVMPLADRNKITDLAKDYKFTLIEDATYRELRYSGEPLPSLFELMPEHTIHMSSFSKLISPGLRVGYMVGNVEKIQRLQKYAQNTYISSTFLSQAAVYQFIQKGMLTRQIEFLKGLYSRRLSVLLSSLKTHLSHAADWIEPDGGFFVGVYLKDGFQLAPLDECRQAGLGLFNNTKFFLKGGGNFIRLPFCTLNDAELVEGINRLKGLVTVSSG